MDSHERENLLLKGRTVSSTDSTSNGFGSFGSTSSGWSSPFGSELGSTETESDEEEDDNDEFIAELTRQMADYMLNEEEEDDDENAPGKTISGPTLVPADASQTFSDDQSRAVHLYKLENQPSAKRQTRSGCCRRRVKKTELSQHQKQSDQLEGKGRRGDAVSGGGLAPPATVWTPPLQRRQQVGSGSGMRAVFLGAGPGSRAGSCGTGVFLPRGAPVEVRKKSECSTVLIPARVLQALQLHFEDMNARSPSKSSVGLPSHPPKHDMDAYPQRKQYEQSRTGQAVNHLEMDLPHEWTY